MKNPLLIDAVLFGLLGALMSSIPGTDLATLDCLGRLPIPLRRPVKTALDRAAARHGLRNFLLTGGEWRAPFADLLRAESAMAFPGLVVTPWSTDMFAPGFRRLLAGGDFRRDDPPALRPACAVAGLADPDGALNVFAVIPLVFLVDNRRLGGRPIPRRWDDLLDPAYRGEVVFGGWRPHAAAPYEDLNDFLLLALLALKGADGLAAFAANVRELLPNIRTSRIAGSNNPQAAAVAVMPWMQADISPRRDRVTAVWPEDGALAMPLWSIVRRDCAERVGPLLAALEGAETAAMFDAHRYPAAGLREGGGGLPPGSRLLWPGWAAMTGPDVAERVAVVRRQFFSAQVAARIADAGRRGVVSCA